MNEDNQEQRQESQFNPIDAANSLYSKGKNVKKAINAARGIVTAGQAAGSAAAAIGGTIASSPVLLAAGAAVGLTLIIILFFPGSGGPSGYGIGTGYASSCLYYRESRDGKSLEGASGVKFGNPEMAAFVSSTANYLNVPPAVLGGFMRVESAGGFQDSNKDFFNKDYDPHCSSAGACGIMQFMPGTFGGVFNQNKEQLASLFKKTSIRTSIDPYESMMGPEVFRIYSIKDSIVATAFHIKSLNNNRPWTKDVIYDITSKYFSGRSLADGGTNDYNCGSETCNYGADVWNSYSNCIASGTGPGSGFLSCPLAGKRAISCGSFRSYPKYNTGSCSGNQPDERGHCGINYGFGCYIPASPDQTLLRKRAHAVDVPASAGEVLVAPYLGGDSVVWQYIASYQVSEADGGGQGLVFTTNYKGNVYQLELVHQNPLTDPSKRSYTSGENVTTVASTFFNHLHLTLGKDVRGNIGPGWLNPEDLGACTNITQITPSP